MDLINNNEAFYAYLNDTISRWFFPFIDKEIKVLDFGCGNGFLTECIQQSFFNAEVIGVDVDVKQLEKNKEAYPEISFRVFSGTVLPFDEASFDLIYAVNVFHHIPTHEQQEYAHELVRILKSTGSLLIFETNPYNLWARRAFVKEHHKEAQMISAGRLRTLFTFFDVYLVKNIYLYPHCHHFFEPYLQSIPFGSLHACIIQKR